MKRKRLSRAKVPSGFFRLSDARLLNDDQLVGAELTFTPGTEEHTAVKKELKRRGIW